MAERVVSVREFGAVGDGRTDDMEAFRRAFGAVLPGGSVAAPQEQEESDG